MLRPAANSIKHTHTHRHTHPKHKTTHNARVCMPLTPVLFLSTLVCVSYSMYDTYTIHCANAHARTLEIYNHHRTSKHYCAAARKARAMRAWAMRVHGMVYEYWSNRWNTHTHTQKQWMELLSFWCVGVASLTQWQWLYGFRWCPARAIEPVSHSYISC